MAVSTVDIAPPSFNVTRDGATATRVLKLDDWNDVEELLQELFNPQFFPNASTLPAQYPGFTDLFVNNVSINAQDTGTTGPRDSDGAPTPCGPAIITVNYATLPTNQGRGDQNEESDLPDMEFSASGAQQIQPYGSASNWKWETAIDGDDSVAEDATPEGFPVSVVDWTLKRTNVYNPNWVIINSTLGHVNSVPFMGYTAETILYENFTAQQGRGNFFGNVVVWNFTFQMRARIVQAGNDVIVGWNHFLREQEDGTSAWQKLNKREVGSGEFSTVFPTADLNSIFLIG